MGAHTLTTSVHALCQCGFRVIEHLRAPNWGPRERRDSGAAERRSSPRSARPASTHATAPPAAVAVSMSSRADRDTRCPQLGPALCGFKSLLLRFPLRHNSSRQRLTSAHGPSMARRRTIGDNAAATGCVRNRPDRPTHARRALTTEARSDRNRRFNRQHTVRSCSLSARRGRTRPEHRCSYRCTTARRCTWTRAAATGGR